MKPLTDKQLIHKLIQLREKTMSQREMAAKLKHTQSWVSKFETQARLDCDKVNLRNLVAYAWGLGLRLRIQFV